MKLRDGRRRSYCEKKERVEMMEQVSKAVRSFSCALKVVSFILKFLMISATVLHVAREKTFLACSRADNGHAIIRVRFHDSRWIMQG